MSATLADVRATFAHAKRTAESIGVDGADRWVLQEGSKTYGRAWRIYCRDPETGGLYGASDYLGTTRTEAERTLRGIAHGMIVAAETVRAREAAQ
ncbi:hypothetical protein V2J52_02755 [Georgenia sp. MJ173]|uniref:hypothetical protein n=1 Tax=Georgenia sunbinii TaxID=3117728 RepID=UPI002F261513